MKKKRKESQANKVKKYLEAGNSITPIDALKMFGSFRLAAIICNLKKDLKVEVVKGQHDSLLTGGNCVVVDYITQIKDLKYFIDKNKKLYKGVYK